MQIHTDYEPCGTEMLCNRYHNYHDKSYMQYRTKEACILNTTCHYSRFEHDKLYRIGKDINVMLTNDPYNRKQYAVLIYDKYSRIIDSEAHDTFNKAWYVYHLIACEYC